MLSATVRLLALLGMRAQHLHSGVPLRVPIGDGELCIDDQPGSVPHQEVPGEAQGGSGVVALAEQADLWVRGRGVDALGAIRAVPARLGGPAR